MAVVPGIAMSPEARMVPFFGTPAPENVPIRVIPRHAPCHCAKHLTRMRGRGVSLESSASFFPGVAKNVSPGEWHKDFFE